MKRGALLPYVCERLSHGHLVAIDRSKKMIQWAARRNSRHVASGRATFSVADAEDVDFGKQRFDKIFAIRVGLFQREPQVRLEYADVSRR